MSCYIVLPGQTGITLNKNSDHVLLHFPTTITKLLGDM